VALQDLSWSKPAKKWEGVLEELMDSRMGSAKAAGIVTPVQEKGVKEKTAGVA
jgi:hypothetical protein